MYKTASEYVKSFVIYLDLLIYSVLNFANDIVRSGLLADNNVIPGNHTGDALPNKNKIEEKMYDSWYSY